MAPKNDLHKPSENKYLSCIRCGLCLSNCPTYREYLTETSSPRGRVALARKGLEGDLTLTPNLYEQMYACFDCLACNQICPVGIRPADLALEMRYLQEQTDPKKWKGAIFSGLLPNPGRMENATLPLRLYQMLGIRKLVYALGLRWLMPGQLRDMEAMLPRLPQRPLRSILPEITEGQGKHPRKVGFFLGCAQSLLFADESAATVRVLTRNNCTVVTPRDTQCCGMPAMGYGRQDTVLAMARHNIELFEKADVENIITDCATCGSTLKEYGKLLSDDPQWSERAQVFSDKVRDISEFLMEIPIIKPDGIIDARITYHDPCHLRRGQNVWKEPRELIKMIEGAEFIEMNDADWCCGSAGSQLITHYETSLKVLNRKMKNVKETGAEIIASGCPGCQMQLNVGVRRHRSDIKVVHPILLLDQAYSKKGK
ncbi:MAG: (Fe-S)-binding protein [Deltaproteobacteria bacterium]|nr:(Fe-S)-binding protein [Deltaproteobacteria bacterium]